MFNLPQIVRHCAVMLISISAVLSIASTAMSQNDPEMKYYTRAFDSYRITYATTNPMGRHYARIDYFYAQEKVGQMLFGNAISPGSHASRIRDQIHLYYDLEHFEAIAGILRNERNLALYVEFDPMGKVMIGGVTNALDQRNN